MFFRKHLIVISIRQPPNGQRNLIVYVFRIDIILAIDNS
ncbi:hypothetical protein A1OE_943 [Candidatus Endolissoclinum faulkneri L2]|uniref:Uncharacterized protein n=1 Tax=Candidatus Endolissoclinum faulkneri L2 TaxID=1193729 RepID=K7ZD28_9PROT|nr:hypothetical protein A1OE_943 [Candidatus Endolissoclinum faulkneri L2]